jgi:hypothetical protein
VVMILKQLVESMSDRENRNLRGTCPSVALSVTDPTQIDLGSNAGSRGGKPATDYLSYGMAR